MKIKTKLITAVSVFTAMVTVACGSIAVGASGLPFYDNERVSYKINTSSEEKHDFYMVDKDKKGSASPLAHVSQSAGNHWWWCDGWKTYAWLYAGPTLSHTYASLSVKCTYVNKNNGALRTVLSKGYKKYSNTARDCIFHVDKKGYSSSATIYIHCNGWGQVILGKNGGPTKPTKVDTYVRAVYA